MQLGNTNIFKNVDATSSLGSFSNPGALEYSKDTSSELGAGGGITNVVEVTSIINNIIYSTSISNFYDVSATISSAPSGSLMVMGSDGKWTYETPYVYELPEATTSILGGVIIGYGLTITDGVVSVDPDSLPSIDISASDISHWNTAYGWGDHSTEGYSKTDSKWDGGSTSLVAATGRSSLGGTTVGQALFTLTNPSAIRFPRINANNSVSALTASEFLTAIGGDMVYPSAGIALSSGSGWSASITNNSARWNEAYGWGDHADSGYALTSALSGYSQVGHTHSYLPLAGGTMSNTTLVSNLNAALLEGHPASYFSVYHTHPYLSNTVSYLPLSGGTMSNTTLVANLNAALLEGHAASYFSVAHSHPYISNSNPWIVDWNNAFAWGNHATFGYLTEVPDETDPIFTAWDKSTGISITASQVSNFTTSVNANTNVSASYALKHAAVTLGTANGLSLSTQALSLQLADTTHTGALSAYDWNRFNNMLSTASFQPLEDQRLSTTDDVVFDSITGSYLETTSIIDDEASLGSLAGFESASGVVRRFTKEAAQEFLELGPNAYTDVEYYLDTNPDGFVHELTSEDGSVTIADIVYDPVDATKHGIDLSVPSLFRYVVVATSGSEVEVLATKLGITASFAGQTLTYTLPDDCRIVSSKIRFGSYSSLTIKTGVKDMTNSSANNRWLPMVQAWREDTRSQLMSVNIVPSETVFDEVTINGLINSTTNHIRLQF